MGDRLSPTFGHMGPEGPVREFQFLEIPWRLSARP